MGEDIHSIGSLKIESENEQDMTNSKKKKGNKDQECIQISLFWVTQYLSPHDEEQQQQGDNVEELQRICRKHDPCKSYQEKERQWPSIKHFADDGDDNKIANEC